MKIGNGHRNPQLARHQRIRREEQHNCKDSLRHHIPHWNASAIKQESSLPWSMLCSPEWQPGVAPCAWHSAATIRTDEWVSLAQTSAQILTFGSIPAGKGLWFLILHLLGSDLKGLHAKAFSFLDVCSSLQPSWLPASLDSPSRNSFPWVVAWGRWLAGLLSPAFSSSWICKALMLRHVQVLLKF